MYLWFTSTPFPAPLGFYDRPSDVVGVDSVLVPHGRVSRVLRDVTSFVKRLDDLVPGLGDFLTVLEEGL